MRSADGTLVAGVASGVAAHLGLTTLVVRGAFVVLAATGGFGVLLYAVLWVVLPSADEDTAAHRPEGRWTQAGRIVALAALFGGAFWLLELLGLRRAGESLLPVAATVVGAALVWRQADDAQRARWRATAQGGRGGMTRTAAGAALLVVGLAGFLATRGQLTAAREGLLSTVVVVVGLALLSLPWWFRMAGDLQAERHQRIRSQERAEVATHVHDSVLQTLALIRKAAGDPREVTRLARAQERDLRTWLYRPPTGEATFGAELEKVAADVDATHGVAVEVVAVGDRPMSESLAALVAAARESMVNAALHSGAEAVSVYAEAGADEVSVYVRDRGCGFDPSRVPAGRYGVAESIVGRMSRRGGTADIRSGPGEGTEVRLVMRSG